MGAPADETCRQVVVVYGAKRTPQPIALRSVWRETVSVRSLSLQGVCGATLLVRTLPYTIIKVRCRLHALVPNRQ